MIALPTKVEFPESHPLAGPVEQFLTDLANAGKSPHTLRCYRGDLAQFACHHHGGVEAIDAGALRGFLSAISGQAKATRARKQAASGPLRYASAEQLWRKYCAAAGERITQHQLRHTHGTELVNDGVPIETVRKRLGHSDIRSTLLYAEKTDKAADDEIRAWRRKRRPPTQRRGSP